MSRLADKLAKLLPLIESGGHPEDVASARFQFKQACLDHAGEIVSALRTADAEPGGDVVERARKIAAEVLCRENWKPGVKAGIYDEIMAGHHDGEPLVVVALRALNATKPTDAEVRREALEEAARIADSFRDKWSNAGGFGGNSAGARIIAAVIRQHKDGGHAERCGSCDECPTHLDPSL